MARNVIFDFRLGGGSSTQLLYGTVSIRPTSVHAVGTSLVLPAKSVWDLVGGKATAINVAPSPDPVDGLVPWAYEVEVKDTRGRTYTWLVGVPEGTEPINFNVLPRYSETKPPLFGEGPQGIPGEGATVAVGTVVEGGEASVTNSGTSQEAIFDFVLPEGPQGPPGMGVNSEYASKLFTDPPSAYPVGVTTGLYRASDGWPLPASFSNVETFKHGSFPASVMQIITPYATAEAEPTYRKAVSADAWGPVQPLRGGVATTTANGLMSSADKSKLEGITPVANSKTFSALPNTYSTGVSIVQVRASDGWPLDATGTVVTHKTSTDSTAVGQWLYPAEGGEPLYRSSNASGLWTEFSTIATHSWVDSKFASVTPEQFGAVGNGIADDTSSVQEALTYSIENGRQLQLRGGATYRTTSSLTSPLPNASTDVSVDISTYGAGKATIKLVGTTNADIMTLRGAVMGTTKLTNYVKVLDKSWGATSASSFRAGYLMAVRSSVSWYYDPRPESTDSRKSELHRIYRVTGNDIYSEGPAEDGYNPSVESTDLVAIKPIKVSIKNIHFERDLPAEGTSADGLRRVGLRVYMADEPLLENLSFYGLTASGTRVYDSYNGTIRDCSVKASNNYFEGYGITVAGTAHFLIDNCHIATSRRGVDVSQGTYSVARHTTIQNCVVTGGGRSSRGEWFGWDPLTNALGSRQSGLGTHGAAEYTTYLNNTIYSMTEMLSCNGGHEVAKGNTFIGKTNLACIGLAQGGGIAIFEGNVCMSGWMGTAKLALSVSDRRPRDFIQVYPSWNSNNNNNSRLVVRNNYAEIQRAFILFGTSSPATTSLPRYVNVVGNRAGFADGTTNPGYLLYNPTINLETTGAQWVVGVNELRHDNNAGSVSTTRNINLNGAQVLDFGTSGPTT